jgi:hypothetical protein
MGWAAVRDTLERALRARLGGPPGRRLMSHEGPIEWGYAIVDRLLDHARRILWGTRAPQSSSLKNEPLSLPPPQPLGGNFTACQSREACQNSTRQSQVWDANWGQHGSN